MLAAAVGSILLQNISSGKGVVKGSDRVIRADGEEKTKS